MPICCYYYVAQTFKEFYMYMYVYVFLSIVNGHFEVILHYVATIIYTCIHT